jgi:uncharacterized protein YjbI with pentapeptide repeats
MPQDSPLSTAILPWTRGASKQYSVIAKASFVMLHEGYAHPTAPWPIVVEDRHVGSGARGSVDEASDLVPGLRTPEVLLRGHAMGLHREAVLARSVRLVVVREERVLDKTLHVYGERSSTRGRPRPFGALPLCLEYTVGGPGTANPFGVVPPELPRIVHAGDPSQPGGFGPRAVGWTSFPMSTDERKAYDDTLPELDPFDRFQRAPADQRLERIEGDEWIVVDGMHAELERFATRLPRPRVTASLRESQGGSIDVVMVPEQILVDAERWELSVVWRGHVDANAFTEEPTELLARLELGEPRPRLALASTVGSAARLGGGMRLGERSQRVSSEPPATTSQAPTPPEPTTAARAPAPQAEPAAIAPSLAPHVEPAAIAPAPVPQAALVAIAPLPVPHEAEAQAVASPPAPLVRAPASTPLSPPALPPVSLSPPRSREPSLLDDGSERGLRTTVAARLATGASLADLSLVGADLSGLDFSGRALGSLVLQNAKLVGCSFRDARLAGARLSGADLTDAVLVGADLSHADLARATLLRADATGASLADANLSGASAAEARFDEVRAARAIFSQATWVSASFQRAQLVGADFSASQLDRASFDEADLTTARFVDAQGDGASFARATLVDANLAGVTLPNACIDDVRAERSVWDRGALEGASFERAELGAAGFSRTKLDRTRFCAAKLSRSSFMGAAGEGVDISEADLEGADLRQAKFGELVGDNAILRRVNGLKLTAPGARLVGAQLTGASLRSARLKLADLDGANLVDVDLRDADLEGAKLRRTERAGTKLAGANLRGAEEDPT